MAIATAAEASPVSPPPSKAVTKTATPKVAAELPPRVVRPTRAPIGSKLAMLASPNEFTSEPSPGPFDPTLDVLVVIFQFPDRDPFPYTHSQVQSSMDTFNSWLDEVSYGRKHIATTIVDAASPYNSCTGRNIVLDAFAAADPLVDYTRYDTFFVLTTDGCTGAAGSVGTNDEWQSPDGPGGIVHMGWAENNVASPEAIWRIAGHELGHNMGLGHADFLDCGSEALKVSELPGSPQTPNPGGCSWGEYGDIFDRMGSYWTSGHYDAPHKYQLGFFTDTQRLQDVTAPGTYTIDVLETASPGTKALRIPRRTGPNGPEKLWVEYRQPIGVDGEMDPTKLDGVLVHIDNMIPVRPRDTLIVDGSPSAAAGSGDPAIELNRTIFDPVSNWSITLVGRTATTATVRIEQGRPLACAATPAQRPVDRDVLFTMSGGVAPFTWSAPGGTPFSGSGTSFVTRYSTTGTHTVTVSSPTSVAPGTCTVTSLPIPTTGTLQVSRTTSAGQPFVATQANVDAAVGQPGTSSAQPAFFTNLNPGTHAANATAVNGHTMQVGQCEYEDGFPECTVPSFSNATCSAGNCAFDADVRAGFVRKVEFRPPLTCGPVEQTTNTNLPVSFEVSGGTGPYTWSAPAGAPSSGAGSTFTTR